MAEVGPEKSGGLKFAERQLLRHGWEYGKGLGRAENGISEAIKVKVKCDKGGVGHKEGEQFTFHWWDHVFNKASSSLQVESDESGIKLKKTVEEDEEGGMISNKKPRKAALARDKLYGCFVKSATLLSGQEQPEPKPSDSDNSSSSDEEEDDRRLDLSSTTNLSDAELMKACGGRTAHKGARHGLTMNAKLARLEQQEAEFMAKYGKKSEPSSASPVCGKPAAPTARSADERQGETAEDTESKQRKKKKKGAAGSINGLNDGEVSESPEADVKPTKKKKKKKVGGDAEESTDAASTDGANGETDNSHKTKKKHKKKKNSAEQIEEERSPSPAAEGGSPEQTAELHADRQGKKKKKKKKKSSSKQHSEQEESNDTESSRPEPVQDGAPKTKKRKAAGLAEKAEVVEEASRAKQKRTKCEKDNLSEEALPPKKKKKKNKSKD